MQTIESTRTLISALSPASAAVPARIRVAARP